MAPRVELQQLLGPTVRPCNLALYVTALTHKSAAQESSMSQERLEFLGDAVLSLCVTLVLYAKFPTATEGALTKMRVNIVNGAMLATIGRSMGLEGCIVAGGKLAAGMTSNDRIFEDTFEALVGAVFIDQGIEVCTEFVAYHIERCVDISMLTQDKNYKDLLRNELQRTRRVAARYECTKVGDVFACAVFLQDTQVGEGEAQTKKKAEMEAAFSALRQHFPEALRSNTLA